MPAAKTFLSLDVKPHGRNCRDFRLRPVPFRFVAAPGDLDVMKSSENESAPVEQGNRATLDPIALAQPESCLRAIRNTGETDVIK
jgi:hypothetical protein